MFQVRAAVDDDILRQRIPGERKVRVLLGQEADHRSGGVRRHFQEQFRAAVLPT
ncbi:hypothetical protein OIE50_31810 [Streptomyces canus]|uniref:hypothetical protein n=1 Tax=Streptomyces canus TaxID=58343 RepID=UPI00225B19F5